MIKAKAEIAQEEKIKALRFSVWTSYIMIPALYAMVILLWYLGFQVHLLTMSIIFGIGLGLALAQHYLLKKKWLIDTSYRFLYVLFFWILITIGIRYTGCILSPFIWVGLFAVINETIYYSFRRGMLLAAAFIVFFWTTVPLDSLGILPHSLWIPDFDPSRNIRFVYSLLIGYTLFYVFIPSTVGYLSDQLRKEKQVVEKAADEQKRAYRMNLSILEDLGLAKNDLESRIKDIADSHRATLHLLRDVGQAREDAEEKAIEIAKLYEDLKVVDKMKTEFLSVVSHELRTPLTPIMAYVSMFLSETLGPLSPEYKKASAVIGRSGEHLLSIIESLLDVSRMERGMITELKREPIALHKLAAEIIEAVQPQAQAREIGLKLDLPDKFPTIIADPIKIERLLANLLGNALRFTPRGGQIAVCGIPQDGNILVQVIDNGIGIAKENQEKIFQKFYQVDSSFTRAVGGMGVGLAVAKEIVEAHGGRIWVESEGEGRGAKFCFTLPISGGGK
jgi:signal transduction histidine kinase